jgi:homoserine trans-succinylase
MKLKNFCRLACFIPGRAKDLSAPLYRYYRGADKSLARPTSRYILFDGENISFDASLVIYINSTNIHIIMIINRIYETANLLSFSLFPSWSG